MLNYQKTILFCRIHQKSFTRFGSDLGSFFFYQYVLVEVN